MRPEIDLAMFVASVALFTVVAGTYEALQLLSYGRTEKNGRNGEASAAAGDAADRLLDNPVANYFALGYARMATLGAAVVAAHRFVKLHIFDGSVVPALALATVLVVLAVPFVGAKVAALASPSRFVTRTRFVTFPFIYGLRPASYLTILVLRTAAPRVLEALAAPILPLKERFELFGSTNGAEQTDEHSLVSSVFEFGDTKAREIMVPRIDMVAVDVHMDASDAIPTIMESGHSRIPVFDESVDKVVGVIHTKDLLKKIVAGAEFTLADIRRDAYFVPESKKIDELLSEFKRRRKHVAIVVDEYGGTAGLITLEDVLEELVGEIHDEFDVEDDMIRRIDGDTALCSARIRLEDLNEALSIALPEGDVDTLGGFVYEEIGRVPRVGEEVQRDPLTFKVHSVSRQRIDKVLITGLSALDEHVGDGLV